MFAVLSPSGKRVIEEHKDDWLLSGAQCGQRENHIMENRFTKEAQKKNTEKQTTTEHLSLSYFLLNLKSQGNLQSSRQRRHYAALVPGLFEPHHRKFIFLWPEQLSPLILILILLLRFNLSLRLCRVGAETCQHFFELYLQRQTFPSLAVMVAGTSDCWLPAKTEKQELKNVNRELPCH